MERKVDAKAGPGKGAGGPHYGYLIVISCCVILFGPVTFVLGCTGLFIGPASEAFGLGRGVVSMVQTVMFATIAVSLPLMGKVFSSKDARVVTTCAILCLVAAFAIQALVLTPATWFGCGVLYGLGLSVLLHLMTSGLTNRWFTSKVGLLIGIAMAFTGIGGVVWNTVIGSIVNAQGMQAAFAVEAGLSALLGLPFSIFVLRSRPEDKGLAPCGRSEADGGLGQPKARARGLDYSKAVRTKAFVGLIVFTLLINICMYTNTMNASFIGSLPLASSVPLLGATVTSVMMAGQTIGKVVLGATADKNLRLTIVGALGLGVLGFLGYLFLPERIGALYVSGAFVGVFISVTNVVLPIVTRTLFGAREYVHIYSRVSMAASIAGMLQAPVLGTVVDRCGGFVPMYVTVIVLLAIACFVILASLADGKRLASRFTEGEVD